MADEDSEECAVTDEYLLIFLKIIRQAFSDKLCTAKWESGTGYWGQEMVQKFENALKITVEQLDIPGIRYVYSVGVEFDEEKDDFYAPSMEVEFTWPE